MRRTLFFLYIWDSKRCSHLDVQVFSLRSSLKQQPAGRVTVRVGLHPEVPSCTGATPSQLLLFT